MKILLENFKKYLHEEEREELQEGILRDLFNKLPVGKIFKRISNNARREWGGHSSWEMEDAHRHMLAAAYFTDEFGKLTATSLGTGHEIKGVLKKLLQGQFGGSGWKMDHANNELGMAIAQQYPDKSLAHYNKIVFNKIKDGDFYLEDGRTKYKDAPHKRGDALASLQSIETDHPDQSRALEEGAWDTAKDTVKDTARSLKKRWDTAFADDADAPDTAPKDNAPDTAPKDNTPVPSPKKKKIKKRRRKKSPYTEQMTKQLTYLADNAKRAGINENFVVVDDVNGGMYVFAPDFKQLARFPVITGGDAGEVDEFNFADWLRQEDMLPTFKDAKKNIKSDDEFDRERGEYVYGRLFEAFLKARAEAGHKITPSGVFTISKIRAGEDITDTYNYGTNIFSLSPGIDPQTLPTVRLAKSLAGKDIQGGSTIAMHGTGNPDRIAALKKANSYARRGDFDKAAKALGQTPSYGCINLENRNAKKLAKYMSPGSQVFILPEDDTIVRVGTFNRFTQELENITMMAGKCFDKVVDFFDNDPVIPKAEIEKKYKKHRIT